MAVDQTRLMVLNGEYARFSKAAGLKTQRERAFIATGIPSPEATSEIAAIFTPNTKYRTEEGTFDLEQAKKDYETFLTTVPEKHKIYLRQSFETVQYCCDETRAYPYGYAFHSDPKKKIVADTLYYNPSHPDFWYHPFKETVTHELAHRIDNFFARSMDDRLFSEAIAGAKKTIDADPKKFLEYCMKCDANGFLSDILSAITDGERRYVAGHPSKYWKTPGNKEKEVFANIFTLEALQSTDLLAFIRENFPEIIDAYDNLDY